MIRFKVFKKLEKIKNKHKRKIIFLFSLFLVFVLFFGIIKAESNTKKISFKNNDDYITIISEREGPHYMDINLLWFRKRIDFSYQYNKINDISIKVNHITNRIFNLL